MSENNNTNDLKSCFSFSSKTIVWQTVETVYFNSLGAINNGNEHTQSIRYRRHLRTIKRKRSIVGLYLRHQKKRRKCRLGSPIRTPTLIKNYTHFCLIKVVRHCSVVRSCSRRPREEQMMNAKRKLKLVRYGRLMAAIIAEKGKQTVNNRRNTAQIVLRRNLRGLCSYQEDG